jgi:hypothetical protein
MSLIVLEKYTYVYFIIQPVNTTFAVLSPGQQYGDCCNVLKIIYSGRKIN